MSPVEEASARDGKPLKAVLFDKDGTLLDFPATWLPILRDLALDLTEGDTVEAARLLKLGGYDVETGQVASGSVLAVGNTADIVSLWFPREGGARRNALTRRIDAHFYEGAVSATVPVAGLEGALERLSAAHLTLGIATSDATATARATMRSLGLEGRFTSILGYDSVPDPKPAPDMVWAFCRAASLDPSEVAVVGDSSHDLSMARSAGAGAAIGVLSGTSGPDELTPLADAVLGSIAELPGWLGLDQSDRRG